MPNADIGLRSGTQRSLTIWTGDPANGVMLSLFQGEIIFRNGETGTCAGVESIDQNDDDAFRGNLVITLRDGSMSRQAFEGRTVLRETAERLRGTGVWSFVESNGRFTGLTGGGTFRWQLDGATYRAEFTG